MRCTTFVAVLVVCCAAGLRAQEGDAEAGKLRHQIDILQRQLHRVENEQSSSRVTQLGGKKTSTRGSDIILRVYDVSDLFATAPAYPAHLSAELGAPERRVFPLGEGSSSGSGSMGGMGGMGGGGGGFFAVAGSARLPQQQVLAQQSDSKSGAAAEARTSIESLIEAITSTISPTNWDETGGPGTIGRVGNSLLISTDRQSHEQIEELLGLFRKKWGTLRTISVRASWLWLGDDELAALVPADGVAIDGVKAYGIVDEAAWKKQLEAKLAADDARAGYRAVVTCYNGQTVSTVSGTRSLVVTSLEPVIEKDKAEKVRVAYRPVPSVVNEGATLQVTPLANTSGKFLILDVHSRIGKLREQKGAARAAAKPPAEANASAEEVVAALDRPLLMTSELATTLRVPVDRTMLIGGMSFGSEPRAGEPSLYLFVRLSVQELRDDVPAERAAERTPAKAAEPGGAPEKKKP